MQWQGGKWPGSTVGRWVAGLMPPTADIYVEPFAGMCGVLMQRSPADREIVADLDDDLMRWWLTLRDRCDQVIEALPDRIDSVTWADVLTALDSDDDIVWAAGWTCQLTYSTIGRTSRSLGNVSAKARLGRLKARLRAAAARVRLVEFEQMDGIELLAAFAGDAGALIYCDPPYPDTDHRQYGHKADIDALVRLAAAAEARVAVSSRDGLCGLDGWHTEQITRTMKQPMLRPPSVRTVTETVQANFPLAERLPLVY